MPSNQTFPDTFERAAGRAIESLRAGARAEAANAENAQHADHRDAHEAASAGALAYAQLLEDKLQAGPIGLEALTLADLVATAANCGGWLSTTGITRIHDQEIKSLIADGFFVHCPAVPGEWAECYRLVAP